MHAFTACWVLVAALGTHQVCVWLPHQAVAYMALLDRLIAAAYTWYGGELLDVYVFPPRATSDLVATPLTCTPHIGACVAHRLEREIDTKHAALKAESRPGTGRASTRALAAVRPCVVVRVVACVVAWLRECHAVCSLSLQLRLWFAMDVASIHDSPAPLRRPARRCAHRT